MWWAVLAAELLALGCAVLHLTRDARQVNAGREGTSSTYRPLVALLAFAVIVDVLLAVGDCRVLGDARAALAVVVPCVPPAPRGGFVSAAVLGEQAFAMAWPCAVWATSWRVFGVAQVTTVPAARRPLGQKVAFVHAVMGGLRVGPAVLAWALAVAVLVLGRPYGHLGTAPDERAARAAFVAGLLLVVELVSVAGGAVAVVRAWGRPWGRSPVHAAMLVLLATELFVATIGPFVRDPFGEDWGYARVLYLLGFLGVVWTLRPRRQVV